MLVKSSRLGQLEVPESKVINMEKPILGFERLQQYCLVEVDELKPFLWLQSVEDAAVAFLVINPRVFFPDYRIEVNSKEIAELAIDKVEAVETYTVVTVPDDPRQMSVNLQGPILINTENNRAKQLVLVNSEYRVQHYLIPDREEFEGESAARREELVGV